MKINVLKTFCLVSGIACLIATTKFMVDSIDYTYNGIHTTGKISGYTLKIKEETKNGSTKEIEYYYPKFQFTDLENDTIEAESDVGRAGSLAFSEGSKVEILYMPNNPNQATINNFINLWLAPLVLGIFAIIFLLIGFNMP